VARATSDSVHYGGDLAAEMISSAGNAAWPCWILRDYRIIYFATHGLIAGDVKGFGEPSLVLTLPQQPTDKSQFARAGTARLGFLDHVS
jgi:hypothetical protein